MMDNEKILKLFKKFAGDPLDIQGLIVTPVKVEPSPKTFRGADLTNMYFKVTNPDDVPYFSPIVEDRIYDETDDFEAFVNEKIEVYFVPSFKTGMYINEELRSKIQKVFNSVKVIEFTTGTPFIGYERYKLFIESVGLSIGGWDSESYYIINNAKIKSAYKNGEPCDIKEAKDEYTEVFLPDKDSYWETENLYMEIDNILNEYPLFSDPYRNVVSYYDTKFVG
jgi:hypothetical protein